MTQEDLIIDFCKKYKSITSADASYELGIAHLPRAIANLIEKGHKVIKVNEKGINAHTGNPTHWTRYYVGEKVC